MKKNIVFSTLSRKKQYKYPYVLLGLYLTFILITVCLASKITLFYNMILPGGIFVFPFTFCICDIAGEVYGYAYPRLFIWLGVLAEFIFVISVITVSHMATPLYFTTGEAFKTVFDPTLRYIISGLCGLIVGEFLNIYLLSKFKIILNGKFFIFRSLLSTALGQSALTIIVDLLNYLVKCRR